ncbi:GumC family protein [Bradyrhizobium sp. Ce-3]|uniref:GumC family protein n=1 Tax=Bradyrhizobium sp. Ce-3 TaxID=2913970 RepID=UPI001FC87C58|nr:GumC family protein [Bradyrhizobium sp. Ce-3]GKQ53257.1 cell shape-determining protein [Bradyrhizobium sp. Ce-3]
MYTATDNSRPPRSDAAFRTVSGTVSAPAVVISAMQVAGWLLQGWRWLLVAALAGAIAAVGATQLVTPRFTAITDLTISPSNLLVTPNDLYAANVQSDSQILDVESKMRTITSGNVLHRVIDKLGLRNDPEFADRLRLLDLSWLFDRRASDAAERNDLMVALAKRIKVTRQERSYVVTMSVWASEPAMSARLANSIAQTFREQVVRADAERAGRAAQGLTARLGELKAAAAEAEDRTEAFRRAHGLQQGPSGQPLSSEAMERMSGKLTDAKARLAEAEARYNEVSRAVALYGVQAGAVQSQTLSGLLADEAALRRQIATLTQTLGPRHPAMLNAMAESEALTKAIKSETERLRSAARFEVDQAKVALDTLNEETRTLRGNVSVDDQAQVKLRELEREASAKTALYQTFLTRSGEAAERQQIDATDVRVISPAVAPFRPTWPPRPIIAAAAGAALGLLLCAAALAGFGYLDALRFARSRAT